MFNPVKYSEVQMEIKSFKSSDDREITYYKWLPEDNKKIKGVIHIVHGSVEHALRYDHFASYCNAQGFAVYANDHRGHGKSVPGEDHFSYFSDENNGFDLAVDDLERLNDIIREEQKDRKIFMLGHSMGSFMVRKLAARPDLAIDGLLLSGTGGGRPLLLNLGIFLSKRQMKNKGRMFHSPELHNLLFGTLNKDIKNAETESDFISRDRDIVSAYIDDPLCGVTITTEYCHEMLKAIKWCSGKQSYMKISNHLPVYIFSGAEDPVGGKSGREVINVADNMRKAGSHDLTVKLYEGARHETLNEINKEEVYKDTLNWVEERL